MNAEPGANQIGSMMYGPEQQKFNQLELNSVSDANSVMGQSPVKVTRASRSKAKRSGADMSKRRPDQPNFDQQ